MHRLSGVNRKMDGSGLIYLVKNMTTGKMYIGQTKCKLEKRRSRHERAAKRGSDSIFHRALMKYGFDAYEWSVLFDNIDDDCLDAYEIAMIRKYKTLSPNGYNLTDGGRGVSPSDETRQKMVKSHIGQVVSIKSRQMISDKLKGCKRSEETKKKMSKPKTDAHKQNISKAKEGVPVHSDETKEKIALRTRGKTYEEIYGDEMGKEIRRIQAMGAKLACNTPEFRRKMSEIAKKSWEKRKRNLMGEND